MTAKSKQSDLENSIHKSLKIRRAFVIFTIESKMNCKGNRRRGPIFLGFKGSESTTDDQRSQIDTGV